MAEWHQVQMTPWEAREVYDALKSVPPLYAPPTTLMERVYAAGQSSQPLVEVTARGPRQLASLNSVLGGVRTKSRLARAQTTADLGFATTVRPSPREIHREIHCRSDETITAYGIRAIQYETWWEAHDSLCTTGKHCTVHENPHED